MVKIEIDKNESENLLRSLYSTGFTHSNVYPDFEGLAREIKEANREDMLDHLTQDSSLATT